MANPFSQRFDHAKETDLDDLSRIIHNHPMADPDFTMYPIGQRDSLQDFFEQRFYTILRADKGCSTSTTILERRIRAYAILAGAPRELYEFFQRRATSDPSKHPWSSYLYCCWTMMYFPDDQAYKMIKNIILPIEHVSAYHGLVAKELDVISGERIKSEAFLSLQDIIKIAHSKSVLNNVAAMVAIPHLVTKCGDQGIVVAGRIVDVLAGRIVSVWMSGNIIDTVAFSMFVVDWYVRTRRIVDATEFVRKRLGIIPNIRDSEDHYAWWLVERFMKTIGSTDLTTWDYVMAHDRIIVDFTTFFLKRFPSEITDPRVQSTMNHIIGCDQAVPW